MPQRSNKRRELDAARAGRDADRARRQHRAPERRPRCRCRAAGAPARTATATPERARSTPLPGDEVARREQLVDRVAREHHHVERLARPHAPGGVDAADRLDAPLLVRDGPRRRATSSASTALVAIDEMPVIGKDDGGTTHPASPSKTDGILLEDERSDLVANRQLGELREPPLGREDGIVRSEQRLRAQRPVHVLNQDRRKSFGAHPERSM